MNTIETRNGTVVESSFTNHEAYEVCRTLDQKFAKDLVKKYPNLSDEQVKWLHVLAVRAQETTPPAPKEAVNVGSLAAIQELFAKAKQHLKNPKITLQVNDTVVRISPSKKYQGSLNIDNGASYYSGERVYFGFITAEGNFNASRHCPNGIDILLTALAENPGAVARDYGMLTGNCCFCCRPLSDERSTAAGYGPICADHYGLGAEWKNAVNVFNQHAFALDLQAEEVPV